MRCSFNKIREALDNIEAYHSYYVGGSLCIDFEYYPSVLINRNGRGFFYNPRSKKILERHFILPKDMTEKVNKIYNKYKGFDIENS